MSLTTEYLNWSVSPTWSGSLGAGPFAVAHCRYTLMARGLAPGSQHGVQHTPLPGTVRTVAINPGQQWRTGPLQRRDYTLEITGGGIGRGPSTFVGCSIFGLSVASSARRWLLTTTSPQYTFTITELSSLTFSL